jgi:hypothetical protein
MSRSAGRAGAAAIGWGSDRISFPDCCAATGAMASMAAAVMANTCFNALIPESLAERQG